MKRTGRFTNSFGDESEEVQSYLEESRLDVHSSNGMKRLSRGKSKSRGAVNKPSCRPMSGADYYDESFGD